MEAEPWRNDYRWLQDNSTTVTPTNPNDSQVLWNTLVLYGTLFVVFWLLFCWLRQWSPRTYTIRHWVKDMECRLAADQFGFLSWMWLVHQVPEKQFMDQCGVDSLCMVRLLKWAGKVAAVGAFHAIWLIPVYASSPPSPETAYITDYIASITTSHVSPGSPRFYATLIGAYAFFGAALYLLYRELEWFLKIRHRFLHQPRSRNYTVYVHGLPEECKADYDLAEFFQISFGLGRVQEAHVRLHTPELLKLVEQRAALVSKLEHALNVLKVKEIRPTHKIGKREVDSIETYAYELREMNEQITRRIELLEVGGPNSTGAQLSLEIKNTNEGRPLDGGFVTFYNLSSKQAAIQMNHSREPFQMQVFEAPDPDDILWSNVGKGHLQIQLGRLMSSALTVTICLLWTLPISFFSGLSNIEGLEAQFPAIKEFNEENPAMRAILAQVAPFLVVIVNALLPIILTILSVMECHVSNGMVQASLFTKLASFSIIQTFFVSAVSGSVVSQLSAAIENPTMIIELLANELPTKSTFFIQLVFITTVLGLGIEQLRVVPAIMASLRSCFGPNLTEEERNSPWLFLSPLACPPIFNHASALSTVVLYCMILFVYAVIAPLASIVLLVAFSIMASGYSHQFIYIYPATRETGGRLWMSFVGIIINCMVVAQFTVLGLLGLKEAAIPSALMFPLIILTFLFKSYIRQRHFTAMECLPSHDCHKKDAASDFYITESFEDLFVQPELLIKEAFPGNIGGALLNEISLIPRKNPLKKKKRRRKREGAENLIESGTKSGEEENKSAPEVEREDCGTQASI